MRRARESETDRHTNRKSLEREGGRNGERARARERERERERGRVAAKKKKKKKLSPKLGAELSLRVRRGYSLL